MPIFVLRFLLFCFFFFIFFLFFLFVFFFFFKQKTAYEISACLVGSEMCIRDRGRPQFYPKDRQEIALVPAIRALERYREA